MHFVPTDSYSLRTSRGSSRSNDGSARQPGKVSTPHRIETSVSTGERLLDAGATWDLIQEHELFKKGLVDIGDVCERLKKLAQCNGQGPTFEEADIRRVIEDSVTGGRDELI